MSEQSKSCSPWPLIRWGIALAVYVVTFLIGADLLRTARREKEETAGAAEETKLDFEKDLAKSRLETERTNQKLIDSERRVEAVIAEKELASRINEAKKQREVDIQEAKDKLSASAIPMRGMPNLSNAQISGVNSGTNIPAAIKATIRSKAEAQWKNDYAMINYEIDRETNAYVKLSDYNSKATQITKPIIASALVEWKDNYSMVVFEIERQIEAKNKLDRR